MFEHRVTIVCLAASLPACEGPRVTESRTDLAMKHSATAPSAPWPAPTILERLVAEHEGSEARLRGGDPKKWSKGCLIQRSCQPFKPLPQCEAQRSAVDSFGSSANRVGQVVALRGMLNLAQVLTTAADCAPQAHDSGRPCCNKVGCGAVVQCGDTAVRLDGLGCGGDESRLCCNTPAFGQSVIAVGKLIHIPIEPGGIEWQLEDPRLCSEAR